MRSAGFRGSQQIFVIEEVIHCLMSGARPEPVVCSVCVSAENKGPRKVFLPNKLLECLPRLSGLPNERLRWNTNEVRSRQSCLCAAFSVRMAAGSVVHGLVSASQFK